MRKNIWKLLVVRTLFLFLAVAYTATVVYLSLINLNETPVKNLGVGDKFMHLGAYFFMALVWMAFFAFRGKNKKFNKNIFYICTAVTIFGIFIEVLQDSLTTYRTFDVFDALANSLGAVSAGIIVWFLKKNINRVKS